MDQNLGKRNSPLAVAHRKDMQSGQGLVEYILIILVIVVILACLVLVGGSLLWGSLNSVGRAAMILGVVGVVALAVAVLLFVPAYLTYLQQVISGEMKFSDFLSMFSSQQPSERGGETNKVAPIDKPRQSHLRSIIEIWAAIAGIISCLLAALTLIVDIVK